MNWSGGYRNRFKPRPDFHQGLKGSFQQQNRIALVDVLVKDEPDNVSQPSTSFNSNKQEIASSEHSYLNDDKVIDGETEEHATIEVDDDLTTPFINIPCGYSSESEDLSEQQSSTCYSPHSDYDGCNGSPLVEEKYPNTTLGTQEEEQLKQSISIPTTDLVVIVSDSETEENGLNEKSHSPTSSTGSSGSSNSTPYSENFCYSASPSINFLVPDVTKSPCSDDLPAKDLIDKSIPEIQNSNKEQCPVKDNFLFESPMQQVQSWNNLCGSPAPDVLYDDLHELKVTQRTHKKVRFTQSPEETTIDSTQSSSFHFNPIPSKIGLSTPTSSTTILAQTGQKFQCTPMPLQFQEIPMINLSTLVHGEPRMLVTPPHSNTIHQENHFTPLPLKCRDQSTSKINLPSSMQVEPNLLFSTPAPRIPFTPLHLSHQDFVEIDPSIPTSLLPAQDVNDPPEIQNLHKNLTASPNLNVKGSAACDTIIDKSVEEIIIEEPQQEASYQIKPKKTFRNPPKRSHLKKLSKRKLHNPCHCRTVYRTIKIRDAGTQTSP